jgi:Family of unknown function (DUF5681)
VTEQRIPDPPQKRTGRFQNGVSGNPKGRPKGSRNQATVALEELVGGDVERIASKATELALAGNPVALRLLFDRLWPVRQERPMAMDLPELSTTHGAAAKLGLVIEAVVAGRLLPSESERLANLITAQMKAKEWDELERRVSALEKAGQDTTI